MITSLRQWLAEVKDGDVVVVVRLSTVLRVLSNSAHFVLALSISNSYVVFSNPDCDVCRLPILKDIRKIVILVVKSLYHLQCSELL